MKSRKAAALLRGFQYHVQRFATFERRNLHFSEHGLKHARDIGQVNQRGHQLVRRAERKILDDEQINLVAILSSLIRFE